MSSSTLARDRLKREFQAWSKSHPHGFWARYSKDTDCNKNVMRWECGIPGRKDTPWEGATYRLRLEFSDDFPTRPPKCLFDPPLFHPNIFPSGAVCLSIINEEKDWRPTITVSQVLQGIQDLLGNPNESDPAQREAVTAFRADRGAYEEKVRQLAKKYDESIWGAAT